jgi:hypothetical protein
MIGFLPVSRELQYYVISQSVSAGREYKAKGLTKVLSPMGVRSKRSSELYIYVV